MHNNTTTAMQTQKKPPPVPHSVSDHAGAAIRRKRLSTRVPKKAPGRSGPMSIRDLEERLQVLEARDPDLFRAYSRSIQVLIEHQGEHYLTRKLSDVRMLNALIQALWDGNVAAFEADTGVQLPAMSMLRKGVAAYTEGDPLRGNALRREPPHACLFMLRADGNDLAPMVVHDQWVGFVEAQVRTDLINQLVAVNHPHGLKLALAHADGTLTRGDTILDASFKDVVGVATWVGRRPRSDFQES